MAPAASASPRYASINAWLSMMPVEGECRAATQCSAGSMRIASAAGISTTSVTPFSCAFAFIDRSSSFSESEAATISLPQRLKGTPCSSQYA